MPFTKIFLPALVLATATTGCATDADPVAGESLLAQEGRTVLTFERADDKTSLRYEVDLESLTISGRQIERLANGVTCMADLPAMPIADVTLLDALETTKLVVVTSPVDSCSVGPGITVGGPLTIDGGAFGLTIDSTKFAQAPSCKQLVVSAELASALGNTFESFATRRIANVTIAGDLQQTDRPCQ